MGNSVSRLDRFAGTYEKSFARIEKDVEQLKVRATARAQRKASLSRWCSAAVVFAVAVAAAIIYQVQRRPLGYYSYQQHLHRVGGAMALPVVAFAVQWLLVLLLGVVESRDSRKLKSLEAAKRSMIKELKDMTRYDKIKSLIDKFDPDARPAVPTAAMIMAGYEQGTPAQLGFGKAGRQQQQQRQQQLQQQRSGNQMPALLAKGSGQVAGAAAFAVAGAGKALMPLFDKLATTLISDNPMLLEDLRRAQTQVQDAEMRMIGALQDSCSVKFENISLKQRVIDLEKQLDLPLSFDPEALQEQLQQQHAQAQQLPWVMQQCVPPEQQQQLLEGLQGHDVDAAATTGRGGSAGSGSWPGEAAAAAAAGGSWGEAGRPLPQQGAISAPETPCASAAGAAAGSSKQGTQGPGDAAAAGEGAAAGAAMGEGLTDAAADEAAASSSSLRQRRGATAAP